MPDGATIGHGIIKAMERSRRATGDVVGPIGVAIRPLQDIFARMVIARFSWIKAGLVLCFLLPMIGLAVHLVYQHNLRDPVFWLFLVAGPILARYAFALSYNLLFHGARAMWLEKGRLVFVPFRLAGELYLLSVSDSGGEYWKRDHRPALYRRLHPTQRYRGRVERSRWAFWGSAGAALFRARRGGVDQAEPGLGIGAGYPAG